MFDTIIGDVKSETRVSVAIKHPIIYDEEWGRYPLRKPEIDIRYPGGLTYLPTQGRGPPEVSKGALLTLGHLSLVSYSTLYL